LGAITALMALTGSCGGGGESDDSAGISAVPAYSPEQLSMCEDMGYTVCEPYPGCKEGYSVASSDTEGTSYRCCPLGCASPTGEVDTQETLDIEVLRDYVEGGDSETNCSEIGVKCIEEPVCKDGEWIEAKDTTNCCKTECLPRMNSEYKYFSADTVKARAEKILGKMRVDQTTLYEGDYLVWYGMADDDDLTHFNKCDGSICDFTLEGISYSITITDNEDSISIS
jgi:hypothetical protein